MTKEDRIRETVHKLMGAETAEQIVEARRELDSLEIDGGTDDTE